LFVAIDKLDKIGEEKVKDELRGKNFSEQSLSTLFEILNQRGSASDKLLMLANRIGNSANGAKGIQDVRHVFSLLKNFDATEDHVEFDIALARGLSYYTGCIFEVKVNNVKVGSVSGGGRYDNLTQSFGDKENLSGVGFSFGVDRLYDAMEELNLFPDEARASTKVLVCHFDDESMRYGLRVLAELRAMGVASEIYPDSTKLKKQLDFANKKSIPFTVIIGSEEIKNGMLALKDMNQGEQEKLTIDQIIQKLK
jgi:histidyl-tRNA synthetase